MCRRCFDKARRKRALTCSWPNCDNRRAWNKNAAKVDGYCRVHEKDFLWNHPLLPSKLDHVANNLRLEFGCWLWMKDPRDTGSGREYPRGRIRLGYDWLPYRFVYVATVGVIPAPKVLDHLCGQSLCILPTHLEPVGQAENIRRQVERAEGMASPDPLVRRATEHRTRRRIEKQTEALLLGEDSEDVALEFGALAQAVYPSLSKFLLPAYLMEGFQPMTPGTWEL